MFLQYYLHLNMNDELKYSWTNLHPISFLNSYTHYSPEVNSEKSQKTSLQREEKSENSFLL